ncbi:uncharacterized proteins involved in stress response homologs of TerZ and putative cAMP-binding protein CABP1 [Roseburia sp. CAG:197]|nr:uncharacterized proteins involved in stress response homologs of TerZ and putative cAMP-binding protein CABP1 [Roseburia sp. CAG:197]
MISVPMKSSGAVNSQTVMAINQQNIQGPKTSQNVKSLNYMKSNQSSGVTAPSPNNTSISNHTISIKTIPALINPVQKGQKIAIENQGKLSKVYAKLGWNVTNSNCDVDVSAFMLNNSGCVIGDSWFVFYGQETSPDNSTHFSIDNGQDREVITIDFNKLNSNVSKIVFVLTINEALEKHLNFSMLNDAYIRIMNDSNQELVSFKMDEYYSNVTSMMIGEIYQHNGAWKFAAIGNGVAKDLAGLCEYYGVQVI